MTRANTAGVVLAAGHGTRLRPLTETTPKAMLPVHGEPLIDHALRRVRTVVDEHAIAVNAHAHADQVIRHIRDRWPTVHISNEQPEALGTAGALGTLRNWVGGRDVLVHNADAWHRADLWKDFAEDWDGGRIRLLVVDRGPKADFGPWRYTGVGLLPWRVVESLTPVPSGLYEASFRDAYERDEIEFVLYDGAWFDCGTPDTYRAANEEAARAVGAS